METKPVLTRQLFDILIYQRTEDGYFNTTSFVREINTNSLREIRIDKFLSNDKTIEFIQELEESINLNTPKRGDFQVAIKSKRGVNGGSWFHPVLFWKLTAWISPKWEVKVYTWLNDDLISMRLIAGDLYKEMCAELNRWYQNTHKKSTPPDVFSEQAQFLNELAFGNPAGNQRNVATPQQIDLMCKLTKVNIKLIRERVIFSKRRDIIKEFKRLYE